MQINENLSKNSTFLQERGKKAPVLPSDIIDFQYCWLWDFWQETVSSLDAMWPQSNQCRQHALLEPKFLQNDYDIIHV